MMKQQVKLYDISPKIIYLSFGRLTDKISRDWYIDYSIKKGAEVEYWDIVSLMRETHDEKGSLDLPYLRYINSYSELERLLQLNKNALFIILISYSARFSKPYRLLSKYNCKMVFLSWGAMPTSERSLRRLINRFFFRPKNFLIRSVDLLLGIAYRKLRLVNKFDIVFAAGNALTSVDQFAKKVVPFNLCDYDHFINVQNTYSKPISGKYAVFLDINLPYQSDLAICGLPAVDAKNYFESLNNFFDILEKKSDLKVVVAAHPKSKYGSEVFGARECHRMVTAELVKDAEYVITHTSTAISYAVLNVKPIIFIYNDNMMRVYKNTIIKEIQCLASYLNGNLYNVDKVTNIKEIDIKQPDRVLYESYKYAYLTSPESKSSSSAEIFWREISRL